ncbi:DUF4215 domain-containing protein, partial [Candidatus Peregrinibacteria bacterium]|nr:DUF4215 domain-containing protein [Candidatus Peregrinibacteria bacterium]
MRIPAPLGRLLRLVGGASIVGAVFFAVNPDAWSMVKAVMLREQVAFFPVQNTVPVDNDEYSSGSNAPDPCAGKGGDSDGDGICGSQDKCPNDTCGDTTDSDSDGKGDCCDICPTSKANKDADADGVCDDIDKCPNFSPDAVWSGSPFYPGSTVCDQTADTDKDGKGDCCDDCPEDKTNTCNGAECGNGKKDSGEECDLGSEKNGRPRQPCTSGCTLPQCADKKDNDGDNNIDCKDLGCMNCLDCAVAGEFGDDDDNIKCDPSKDSEYDRCSDPDAPWNLAGNFGKDINSNQTQIAWESPIVASLLAAKPVKAPFSFETCKTAGGKPVTGKKTINGVEKVFCKACVCEEPKKWHKTNDGFVCIECDGEGMTLVRLEQPNGNTDYQCRCKTGLQAEKDKDGKTKCVPLECKAQDRSQITACCSNKCKLEAEEEYDRRVGTNPDRWVKAKRINPEKYEGCMASCVCGSQQKADEDAAAKKEKQKQDRLKQLQQQFPNVKNWVWDEEQNDWRPAQQNEIRPLGKNSSTQDIPIASLLLAGPEPEKPDKGGDAGSCFDQCMAEGGDPDSNPVKNAKCCATNQKTGTQTACKPTCCRSACINKICPAPDKGGSAQGPGGGTVFGGSKTPPVGPSSVKPKPPKKIPPKKKKKKKSSSSRGGPGGGGGGAGATGGNTTGGAIGGNTSAVGVISGFPPPPPGSSRASLGSARSGASSSAISRSSLRSLSSSSRSISPKCGNGTVDPGEECDKGAFNDDGREFGCREDCTRWRCGDNTLDQVGSLACRPAEQVCPPLAFEGPNIFEECDDGNTDNGDGCSSICRAEFCGDGKIDQDGPDNDPATKGDNEDCDDRNKNDNDACRNNCKAPGCGDGVITESRGETCDEDQFLIPKQDAACREGKCTYCGDGVVQSKLEQVEDPEWIEMCDDGNGNNNDDCPNDCKMAVCGDGETEGTEQCDDGNDDPKDGCHLCHFRVCGVPPLDPVECSDYGTPGYNDPPPGAYWCRVDMSQSNAWDIGQRCTWARCGDGVVDPFFNGVTLEWEGCDDGNLENEDGCSKECIPEHMAADGGLDDDGDLSEDGDISDEGDFEDDGDFEDEGDFDDDGDLSEDGDISDEGDFEDGGDFSEDGDFADEGDISDEGDFEDGGDIAEDGDDGGDDGGGMCTGFECSLGGDEACAEQNMTCVETSQFPCIKCEEDGDIFDDGDIAEDGDISDDDFGDDGDIFDDGDIAEDGDISDDDFGEDGDIFDDGDIAEDGDISDDFGEDGDIFDDGDIAEDGDISDDDFGEDGDIFDDGDIAEDGDISDDDFGDDGDIFDDGGGSSRSSAGSFGSFGSVQSSLGSFGSFGSVQSSLGSFGSFGSTQSSGRSSSRSSSGVDGFCGDGLLNDGEQCDRNNPCFNGTCNLRSCFCEPRTDLFCGDGIKSPREACDVGTNTCPTGQNCNVNLCICAPGGASACGNSKLDPGEQCDYAVPCPGGDRCNVSSCTCEGGGLGGGFGGIGGIGGGVGGTGGGGGPICGNRQLDPGETCDDGNRRNSDGCSASCRLEPGSQLRCGNGIVTQGEECDDGNTRDFDGCNFQCLLENGACGDGVLQKLLGEQCEPALHSPSLPYRCGTDCRFSTLYCGNGRIDAGEECDDGAQNSDVLPDRCRANCSNARCGDRILDQAEQCDDGDRISGDGCDAYCRREAFAGPIPSSVGSVVVQLPVFPTTPGTVPGIPLPITRPPAIIPIGSVVPLPQRPPAGDTGPAAIAVMAAGAAAGWSWMRRKK